MATGEDRPLPTDPGVEWSSDNGKYSYSAYGTKDVLIIAPDSSNVPPDAVPRRRREALLTEKDQAKLENQGVERKHHRDDVSIMTARYRLDKECSMLEGVFGEVSCDKVKKKISTTLNNTKKAAGMLT